MLMLRGQVKVAEVPRRWEEALQSVLMARVRIRERASLGQHGVEQIPL